MNTGKIKINNIKLDSLAKENIKLKKELANKKPIAFAFLAGFILYLILFFVVTGV